MNERKYKGTAIQMLMATDLIIDNAIAMAPALTAARPKWTMSYLTDLKGNISSILEDNFGIKGTTSLKEVTATLTTKEIAAKAMLQQAKTQIEVDFGKDKSKCSSYLITLGLNKVKVIKNASQDATIEMLITFRNNLTPNIEADLTAAGMSPNTLANIKMLATELYQANALQEQKKIGSKETTATLNAQLNDIYDEVIGIAKIAASLLTEKADIEKFSYSRALKQMGYNEQEKKPTTEKE
jgi:hypothetical protein